MTSNQLAIAPTSEYKALMLDLIAAEDENDEPVAFTNLFNHLDVNGLNDTWLDPRVDFDSSDCDAMMLDFRDGEELIVLVQDGRVVTTHLMANGWHLVQNSGNDWYLAEQAADGMNVA